MGPVLAGVDVGTTSARCVLFGMNGENLGGKALEYGASYPKPGWVEQDADELIATTMRVCREAIADSGIDPARIASVGFSTQRSVCCPVDIDGRLVRPMISWQDARTSEQVEAIRQKISAQDYYELSGLPLGTTWILTKLLWLRDHEPQAFKRIHKIVQNQDLILRAFGSDGFNTDICDMAFYGLWDVRSVEWSSRLLSLFDLDASMFGSPARPGTRVGAISPDIARKTGFAVGTPICVGAGDQNCSVVGMGAIRPGMGTVTLGTAGLAILVTDKPVPGFGGMMVTNHAAPGLWEVEGLSNAAASSFRWFRDEIAHQEVQEEAAGGASAYEALTALAAQSEPGAKGLLYLPYLATAGTPRWNPQARAAFIGLSLAHSRKHLVRAVLEGVALEVRDMMVAWEKQGMQVDVLRIGGGATKSVLWNQIQADIYGRPVQTLCESESTVLGAAILAGVGAGLFSSVEDGVARMVRVRHEIEPFMPRHALYEEMYETYVHAYEGLSDSGAFAALAKIQSNTEAF